MATPTLANHFNADHLFATVVRPIAPPTCQKPQPDFRVFPTGESEYSWRITAVATNHTISRHKSLRFAIRKCSRLNNEKGKGVRNGTN